MAPSQRLTKPRSLSAPTRSRSRSVLSLSAAAAALLAAPLAAQRAPCADALRAGEATPWETAELVVADLTLDGATDAAYWRTDGSRVVVLIGTCDGSEVAQRWRFAFDLPADCPPAEARVEAASLLLDEALVQRLFAAEGPLARRLPAYEPRDEQVEMALEVARSLDAGVVVTILCDTGTRYLSDEFWDEG